MVEQGQQTEGWAYPAGSRKCHYIVNTDALCRKYGFYTRNDWQGDANSAPSPDDCAECRRRLAKRQEASRG